MVRGLWRSVPLIGRVGLGVATVGVAADVIHHVFTHDAGVTRVVDIGLLGHVLTLAGMVLALVGVIRAAADSRRRARQKGGSDAARISAAASR
jgi:hypothetical protein